MSRHTLPAGDIGALLARFSELGQKALMRTERSFPIIVIQEAGLDGFSIYRVLESEGIESHVSIPLRSRRRVGAGELRPTGSTARRCFARFWRISAASLCVHDGQDARTRGRGPPTPVP